VSEGDSGGSKTLRGFSGDGPQCGTIEDAAPLTSKGNLLPARGIRHEAL